VLAGIAGLALWRMTRMRRLPGPVGSSAPTQPGPDWAHIDALLGPSAAPAPRDDPLPGTSNPPKARD
jgi:hypothetical protein